MRPLAAAACGFSRLARGVCDRRLEEFLNQPGEHADRLREPATLHTFALLAGLSGEARSSRQRRSRTLSRKPAAFRRGTELFGSNFNPEETLKVSMSPRSRATVT